MSEADDRLRRRALEGVEAETRLFATAVEGARLVQRSGVVAAINPAAPDRSLFNSVYYDDSAALAAAVDGLSAEYAEAGVRAWTVWVPDDDRATAELLDGRGHLLDAAPRAMALWLEDLAPEPPLAEGFELTAGTVAEAGTLNDRAYGHAGGAFSAALVREGEPPVEWVFARRDAEPASCVGGVELGEDLCVTLVATDPAHQGRGLASHALHALLRSARERGFVSASLQATKAGAPIYERLGFRDLGFIEMWENRVPAPEHAPGGAAGKA